MFKKAIDSLVAITEKHIRAGITKHLMTLNLPPNTCLQLSKDLVAPYPAHLATIASADLVTLFKELKPTADTIDGAGCSDWADLKQRIHYIANLFRCYHDTRDLFDSPFTVEQIAEIKSGAVPGGTL